MSMRFQTAAENYAALVDFFTLYPEYTTRPFYTTGESYAGVYIPTLSALLIQAIQAGTLNINYKVGSTDQGKDDLLLKNL